MSTRQRSISEDKKINIVLITPDQMRADHMSCYGYFRETSPYMDTLAEEGAISKRHYAAASWTTPSFCSIMSSLVPSRHRATLFGSSITNSAIPLLSEQFKMVEYRTVAFCNNANVNKPLRKGFDEFYEGERNQPQNITEHVEFGAQGTNKRIFEWLNQHYNKSFFMWILYFEPHSPYNPSSKHDIFKTSAYPNETNNGYGPERNSGRLYRLANAGDKRAVERLNSLYDGKIHFADYCIGQVLKKLKELNIDKKTLIVLTSDHGELLYEHVDCLTFDHRSLYDSDIYVPLILRGPSIPKGQSIDALVSTLDIVPTILEIIGLPPLKGAQGKSLLPLITGEVNAVHDYIFAEQDVLERLRSVRDKRYKLIYHLQNSGNQLYDTIADSGEQKDISEQHPKIVQRLSTQLMNYMEKNEPCNQERFRQWKRVVPLYKKYPIEEIVDEVTIGARLQFFGMSYNDIANWVKMSDGGDDYNNACYWIEPGDGSRGALWRSDNPLLGTYNIYVWYGRVLQRCLATNACFLVATRQASWTFVIDQNKNVGKWNFLGEFGDPLYVKVTNEADGPVIIDAVKFEQIK